MSLSVCEFCTYWDVDASKNMHVVNYKVYYLLICHYTNFIMIKCFTKLSIEKEILLNPNLLIRKLNIVSFSSFCLVISLWVFFPPCFVISLQNHSVQHNRKEIESTFWAICLKNRSILLATGNVICTIFLHGWLVSYYW